MTTDTALLQQALEALENCYNIADWPGYGDNEQSRAIDAIKARLAQPEQEPVAYGNGDEIDRLCTESDFLGITVQNKPSGWRKTALYTHPQPERTPLSKSVIKRLWHQADKEPENFARAIEKVHGITE
jgi:hypothetical protein